MLALETIETYLNLYYLVAFISISQIVKEPLERVLEHHYGLVLAGRYVVLFVATLVAMPFMFIECPLKLFVSYTFGVAFHNLILAKLWSAIK